MVLSLYWPWFHVAEMPWPGAFVPWWYLFMLGACTRWSLESKAVWMWTAAVIVSLVVCGVWHRDWVPLAGAATATAILTAAVRGRLATWLNFRWLQYLGAISYSLYLLHTVVGSRALAFGLARLEPDSLLVCAALVALAAAISVAAAHLMHRFIERPCVRFARRFKQPQTRAVEANAWK